ncbi:MAG: metal ABC transporter permease [Actinomycetota bacterium]|nr:metal ABC transporter permease [Actinomycetota bacterium]
MSFLEYEFMRNALVAAALVGILAPSIGVFLVQRRLSLMGDGIGHVAFTGVAAGLLLGVYPVYTAVVAAVAGAVVIELLRQRGRTAGDVALALIFYGGIAGAVMLIGIGDVSNVSLNTYLFGSVISVGGTDLAAIAAVTAAIVLVTTTLRKELFAICYDEEVARAAGVRVTLMNLAIASSAALAIAVTMRVVGILLVSAMLVLPVAAVQQVTRSFRATVYASLALGVTACVGGLIIAFYADVSPGATIVLTTIASFVGAAAAGRLRMAH